MKTTTPELKALFDQRLDNMWVHDCLKIQLVTQQVMRYTTADVDIVLPELPGEVFVAPPRATAIAIGPRRARIGLNVETLNIDFYPRDHLDVEPMEIDLGQETALPIPLKFAMENGAFDGARIWVYRAFAPQGPQNLGEMTKAVDDSWADVYFEPVGSLKHFVGFFGKIEDIGTGIVKTKAQSMTASLKAPFPKYVFDHSCVWDLYGAGCRVSRSNWTATGFVTKASTTRMVLETSPIGVTPIDNVYFDDRPDDFFAEGIIEFVTGKNSFVKRAIRSSKGGVLTLQTPLPYEVSDRDGFRLVPGCDKTWTTCRDRFSNEHRFRGFPFVPGPDAMQGTSRPRTVAD